MRRARMQMSFLEEWRPLQSRSIDDLDSSITLNSITLDSADNFVLGGNIKTKSIAVYSATRFGAIITGNVNSIAPLSVLVDNGSVLTISAVIDAGTNGLTKTGPGTLKLTGANSYTGATTVSEGTLELGGGTTSGSVQGDIVNNATLIFNGIAPQSCSGTITGAGTTKVAGQLTVNSIVQDTLQIGGVPVEINLYWDSAAVPSGSTALWDTSHAYWRLGSPTGPLNGWINDSNAFFGDCGGPSGGIFISESSDPLFARSIHFDGDGYSLAGFTSSDVLGLAPEGTTIDVRGGSATIGCSITDIGSHGSLKKTGAGKLTLSGANAYTGGTAIDEGTLQIGDGGTSGNLSAHAVDSIMAGGSLVFCRSDDIEFDFPITGSGNLIKKGPGKLALGAAVVGYAGSLTVDDGELRIGNDIDLDSITVNGGKLICTGSVSGDILLHNGTLSPGVAADGTLAMENLDMEPGAALKINLNDIGGGHVNVIGNVMLNGAVLDLESCRTDNYGVLRVLIYNDGGNAVNGTLSGLPEGGEIAIGVQTYFITYHYNAENGEFGTGNDVALVSSLFNVAAVAADPYRVSAHSEIEAILDAERATSTTAIASDRFQLSCYLSQHDPLWAAGGPSIAFASLDSSVASVDTGGLVTFYQTGTCRIIATATEAGYAAETFEIRLTGTFSGGETTTSFVPKAIDTSNISQYVLVIYNADSIDGTAMMNYYKANRPGIVNATYLGLTAGDENAEGSIAWLYHQSNPTLHLTAIPDSRTSNQAVCNSIAQYVINWLQAARNRAVNPMPIRYVVGIYGLPFSDGSSHFGDNINSFPSVAAMIQAMSINVNSMSTFSYSRGEDRFSIAEYGGPLVAWMDMGSYEATVKYIDKEKAAADAGGLQVDGVTISGTDAGVSGSKYIFDDSSALYPNRFASFAAALAAELEANGVPPDQIQNYIIYRAKEQYSPIRTAANPTAYAGWGVLNWYWTPPDPDWANNGNVTFTGKASWWVGMTNESYNGVYGSYMGDPTDFFADNAFGGANYSNTPICFTVHTAESTLGGCENSSYFDRWARGWSSLEAAWTGQSTHRFLVVTDVFLEN